MSARRRPRSAPASEPSPAAGRGTRVAASQRADDMTPRQLARAGMLFSYATWFALIAAGTAAYEGEPIRVKSKDLPLHWFDLLFRRFGALMLFALWAVRAAATRAWPAAFPRRGGSGGGTVTKAFLLYFFQACVRMAIYQLHVAGYIFTAKRWARDNLSHPPHIMSDHILLGAALQAGFSCEASLALLHLWSVRGDSAQGLFIKLYSSAATMLAALVSCECYFTARFFHPPHEILYAAALGLAMFQAPLLLYAAHEVRTQAAEAAGGKEGGGKVVAGVAAGAEE